ncbi:MAG TPA: 3',5'-cyclic-nucleotide phosphodiesterase [Gemmataceae bacterium]|nr:3',5'-cyclic-nucleotide phosphodiesterase [Gemmataceae bacterium]
MKITLIPSTAGDSSGQHQFLSSCLLNDSVALDAGCLGFAHSPEQQARVRHVLLSHTHLDHLASLPIFLENVYEADGPGVTIHGSTPVLECCQRDLFNDRIWPDFVALSRDGMPFLKLSPFEPGQTIDLDGLRITAVALDHVVPTVGYLIADADSTVAFVSDTGPTDAVWRHANAASNLKAVFLEATFPNSLTWLAEVSKHLTPALFAGEAAKLTRPARLIAVHIKARYRDQVVAELQALRLPRLEVGRFDAPYTF